MLTLFLSPTNGFINILLNRVFGIEPIYFLADPRWFRPVYIASNIWQNVGWGAIIYLAALSRVDMQLYESATIDGASRLQQIRHITIPSIMPTMIILLILRMGNLLTVGFEKVLLLYNPAVYETADVIQTFVYRRGLLNAEFSFGAAVGLFNSIINLILLLSANWISRKVTDTSLW
jgi:putative aldouronate transport system permease protein